MASFTLSCTDVHYQAILVENAEGQVVPVPSGDTFSGASSDATMFSVTIGVMPANAPTPNVPARIVTPLRQPRAGDQPATVTLSDSAGDTAWVDMILVGPDDVATQLVGDTANVFLVKQALPPA